MSTAVLLDAGPLGILTNPRATDATRECNAWLRTLLFRGVSVRVPEITGYEVRRELIRAGKTSGLRRLDLLKEVTGYLPLTTPIMVQAAEFWAEARRRGRPTAGGEGLDCDMILAAQAASVTRTGDDAIIATTNVRHLALFADARRWQDID